LILRSNGTSQRAWTAQQIIQPIFPYDTAPRWLLRYRAAIYGDVEMANR